MYYVVRRINSRFSSLSLRVKYQRSVRKYVERNSSEEQLNCQITTLLWYDAIFRVLTRLVSDRSMRSLRFGHHQNDIKWKHSLRVRLRTSALDIDGAWYGMAEIKRSSNGQEWCVISMRNAEKLPMQSTCRFLEFIARQKQMKCVTACVFGVKPNFSFRHFVFTHSSVWHCVGGNLICSSVCLPTTGRCVFECCFNAD